MLHERGFFATNIDVIEIEIQFQQMSPFLSPTAVIKIEKAVSSVRNPHHGQGKLNRVFLRKQASICIKNDLNE